MALTTPRPACLDHTALFQHPLVENAPSANDGTPAVQQAQLLSARAAQVCSGCPLRQQCLFDAVVNHEVSGVAGGTTEAQRAAIRRRLGVSVQAEDLDSWTGAARSGRTVNRDELVRLRAAHPDESLNQLALRLGCSLSTVKRQLRQARTAPPTVRTPVRPTLGQVLTVAAQVTRRTHPAGTRAA